MGLIFGFQRGKLDSVGDTRNNNFQLLAGSPQRSIPVMSDQDPGVRSRIRRFELGRVVMEVLAEALPDELFRWTKDGEFVDLSGETLGKPDERQAAHQLFWTTHEGLDNEVQFQDRLRFVVNEIIRGYQQLDLAVLQDRMERLLWLEQVLDTESMISAYETLYVLGCLPVGHLCSDYFLTDPAYMIAENSMGVLQSKRDRRAGTGASYRPDSEAWYRVYELAAILKWKGPEADRNRLFTVEELIDRYLGVEKRCLDFLATHPVPDSKREQSVREDLGWCLLQIIKASMRFEPQRAPQLISHFNSIHGPVLESQPGHFLRFASTQRVDPWYWDFELYKACTCGPISEDEAHLCYQWRLDAMRRRHVNDALRSFSLGAKNELEIWMAQVRKDFTALAEVRRAS